jgi:hypothetical protein
MTVSAVATFAGSSADWNDEVAQVFRFAILSAAFDGTDYEGLYELSWCQVTSVSDVEAVGARRLLQDSATADSVEVAFEVTVEAEEDSKVEAMVELLSAEDIYLVEAAGILEADTTFPYTVGDTLDVAVSAEVEVDRYLTEEEGAVALEDLTSSTTMDSSMYYSAGASATVSMAAVVAVAVVALL